jgi:hypothetical protein
MATLILKRAPIGDNEDDYDVLENGVVVGRISFLHADPEGFPGFARAVPTGRSSARRTAMRLRARQRWRHSLRAGDGDKPPRCDADVKRAELRPRPQDPQKIR